MYTTMGGSESKNERLKGTLTMPVEASQTNPVPACVLVHDSGATWTISTAADITRITVISC